MTKRLFIAIEIGKIPPIEAVLNEFKKALNGDAIKWVDASIMHLTLQFLGDTDTNQIEGLKQVIDNSCKGLHSFAIAIEGVGIFKNKQQPKVIWLGIKTLEVLVELYINLHKGLQSLNFVLENRLFEPHLTLGRIKIITQKEKLNELLEQYKSKQIAQVVINEVILFESILSPQGPTYKKLYSREFV
jgi:RNA 2',3'-cyclic 3'-phosphodiesterase